jgi:hypothetical protein
MSRAVVERVALEHEVIDSLGSAAPEQGDRVVTRVAVQEDDARVLEEDPPDLLDRFGVALNRVLRPDDQLRLYPVEVGAPILDDAVVTVLVRAVTLHRPLRLTVGQRPLRMPPAA